MIFLKAFHVIENNEKFHDQNKVLQYLQLYELG